MPQDIIADALNKIMNAKRAGKKNVVINRHSRLLVLFLAIAKLKGYIADYKLEGRELHVQIGKLVACCAIKPRYMVTIKEIDEYISMYLPAKNIGLIIVSTSKGLMSHYTSIEKNIGGSLIAYFY